MINWKIGQKLVCIKSGTWVYSNTGNSANHSGLPKKDFVYTFEGIDPSATEYIYLKEIQTRIPTGRLSFFNEYFKPYELQQYKINKSKEEILNKELILN